jgi:sortase A
VAYQLWWTNVTADQYASGKAKNLEQLWNPGAGGGGSSSKAHQPYPAGIPHGTTFALIYIPKLDVVTPIAEGVDKESILDKGMVGHYTGAQETAFPWASSGNFALAGHRNTHGEPFRYINKLVPGDKVVVETAYDYYTYTVTRTLPQTSPSDVSVIAPVPPESGFTKPGRYITLTTCTPEFTSTYRMAVWGTLTEDLPKSSGQKPKALQNG